MAARPQFYRRIARGGRGMGAPPLPGGMAGGHGAGRRLPGGGAMSLIAFILLCALVGVIVWAVTTYLPMPAPIKTVIIAAAVIVLLLVLLQGVGLDVMVPRLKAVK